MPQDMPAKTEEQVEVTSAPRSGPADYTGLLSPPVLIPTPDRPPSGVKPSGPLGTLCVPSATPTRQLNVLVADDNTLNVRILERRLQRMGHKVRVSRNGQECFDMFVEAREALDFVLMDLNVRASSVSMSPRIPLSWDPWSGVQSVPALGHRRYVSFEV